MKYDRELIEVKPGTKITVHFENEDDLPHNILFARKKENGENDRGIEIAQAAWALGEKGMEKQWIPENARVIAASPMVNPHEKSSITFIAPEEAGDHPFVCTFPGHAMIMNGILRVETSVPPIRNLHFRFYPGHFRKIPNFADLKPEKGGPIPDGKVDIKVAEIDNNFALEFEGYLDIQKSGEYEFVVGGDDGYRLIIDGKKIAEDDGVHPFTQRTQKIKLSEGEHHVLVQYFEEHGGEALYLAWSGPGFARSPLSAWTPDDQDPNQQAERFQGIPLHVRDEARIYRNFMEGSSPRGIAVGYPGGVNLCWDADQMTLAMVWQGGFMDARRHWDDRGMGNQPPLGYDIGHHLLLPSLAILEDQKEWPKKIEFNQPQNPDYRFLGYTLDAKRFPTFFWKFQNVKVTESYEVAGQAVSQNAVLKRVVRFESESPPQNLHFMPFSGNLKKIEQGERGQGTRHWMMPNYLEVSLDSDLNPVQSSEDRVIVPVIFQEGKAEIVTTYRWNQIPKSTP